MMHEMNEKKMLNLETTILQNRPPSPFPLYPPSPPPRPLTPPFFSFLTVMLNKTIIQYKKITT